MPDVYTSIAEQPDAVVEQLAAAMELRATDPQQQAFVHAYLDGIDLPTPVRAVEIGCGTGAIARLIAARPGVAEVVGIDPSSQLVEHARRLSAGFDGLSFHVADGADVPLDGGSADLVVLHTVLSHAPAPERILAEAHRVLRPGGRLAVFDGDYATMTLAIGEDDPLESCAHAFRRSYINDPWVMRRMAAAAETAGFAVERIRSHGYLQVAAPDYLLTIADRGADALPAGGMIGAELAAALKAEARRRVEAGRFFGLIAYASIDARRP
jgi:ubiquinone/menaquinone biosynthesis C-methylase UbiE